MKDRNRNDDRNSNRGNRNDHNRNDRGHNRGQDSPQQSNQQKDPNAITSSGRVRMMFSGDLIDVPRVGHETALYGVDGLIEIRDHRQSVQVSARKCQGFAHKLRDQEAAVAMSPAVAKAKQKVSAMTAAAEFDQGLLSKVEEAEQELAKALMTHEAELLETRQSLETALAEFQKVAMADAAVAIRKDQGSFILEFSAPTAKNCEFLFFKDLNLVQIYEELGLEGSAIKPRIFHAGGQVDRGFFRIYPISPNRVVLMTLCSPATEYVVEQEHLFYHGEDCCPGLLRVEGRNNLSWEVVNLGTGTRTGNLGENKKIAEAAVAKHRHPEVTSVSESPKQASAPAPKPAPRPKSHRPVHDDSNIAVGTSLGEKLKAAGVKVEDPPKPEAIPEPTVEKIEVPVEGGKPAKKTAAKNKATKKKTAGGNAGE